MWESAHKKRKSVCACCKYVMLYDAANCLAGPSVSSFFAFSGFSSTIMELRCSLKGRQEFPTSREKRKEEFILLHTG